MQARALFGNEYGLSHELLHELEKRLSSADWKFFNATCTTLYSTINNTVWRDYLKMLKQFPEGLFFFCSQPLSAYQACCDTDQLDSDNQKLKAALHLAAYAGNEEAVDHLMQKVQDRDTFFAASTGHKKVHNLLHSACLSARQNMNLVDKLVTQYHMSLDESYLFIGTPIQAAAFAANLSAMKHLAQNHSADISPQSSQDESLLCFAIKGQQNIIKKSFVIDFLLNEKGFSLDEEISVRAVKFASAIMLSRDISTLNYVLDIASTPLPRAFEIELLKASIKIFAQAIPVLVEQRGIAPSITDASCKLSPIGYAMSIAPLFGRTLVTENACQAISFLIKYENYDPVTIRKNLGLSNIYSANSQLPLENMYKIIFANINVTQRVSRTGWLASVVESDHSVLDHLFMLQFKTSFTDRTFLEMKACITNALDKAIELNLKDTCRLLREYGRPSAQNYQKLLAIKDIAQRIYPALREEPWEQPIQCLLIKNKSLKSYIAATLDKTTPFAFFPVDNGFNTLLDYACTFWVKYYSQVKNECCDLITTLLGRLSEQELTVFMASDQGASLQTFAINNIEAGGFKHGAKECILLLKYRSLIASERVYNALLDFNNPKLTKLCHETPEGQRYQQQAEERKNSGRTSPSSFFGPDGNNGDAENIQQETIDSSNNVIHKPKPTQHKVTITAP